MQVKMDQAAGRVADCNVLHTGSSTSMMQKWFSTMLKPAAMACWHAPHRWRRGMGSNKERKSRARKETYLATRAPGPTIEM
jgi:hypothetical protein